MDRPAGKSFALVPVFFVGSIYRQPRKQRVVSRYLYFGEQYIELLPAGEATLFLYPKPGKYFFNSLAVDQSFYFNVISRQQRLRTFFY